MKLLKVSHTKPGIDGKNSTQTYYLEIGDLSFSEAIEKYRTKRFLKPEFISLGKCEGKGEVKIEKGNQKWVFNPVTTESL